MSLCLYKSSRPVSAFEKSCLTPLSGGELELPATARSALTDGDLLCLALGEVTALAPQIFRTGLAGRYNTNIEGAALRLCGNEISIKFARALT